MLERLRRRDCWIFDLDGTLTVAAHDFEAIRRALGLPLGQPILEEIAARPADEAERLSRERDAIELEIAHASRPQHGADALLAALSGCGHRLGIVTRNSEENALATLAACDLLRRFAPEDVLGREHSEPKPSPDGIQRLLRRWSAGPERAVMIGDSHFDLRAGRAAGASAVYFDADRTRLHDALADHRVERLDELLAAVPTPAR